MEYFPKLLNAKDSLEIYLRYFQDDAMIAQQMSFIDPISMQRLKNPCRGLDCSHLQCFDLEVYESLNSKKPPLEKRCPVCRRRVTPTKMYVDFISFALASHYLEARTMKIYRNGHIEMTSQSGTMIDLGETSLGPNSNFDNLVKSLLLSGIGHSFKEIAIWDDLCRIDIEDLTTFMTSMSGDDLRLIPSGRDDYLEKLSNDGLLLATKMEVLEQNIMVVLGTNKSVSKKFIGDIKALIARKRCLNTKRIGSFASIEPYEMKLPPPASVRIADASTICAEVATADSVVDLTCDDDVGDSQATVECQQGGLAESQQGGLVESQQGGSVESQQGGPVENQQGGLVECQQEDLLGDINGARICVQQSSMLCELSYSQDSNSGNSVTSAETITVSHLEQVRHVEQADHMVASHMEIGNVVQSGHVEAGHIEASRMEIGHVEQSGHVEAGHIEASYTEIGHVVQAVAVEIATTPVHQTSSSTHTAKKQSLCVDSDDVGNISQSYAGQVAHASTTSPLEAVPANPRHSHLAGIYSEGVSLGKPPSMGSRKRFKCDVPSMSHVMNTAGATRNTSRLCPASTVVSESANSLAYTTFDVPSYSAVGNYFSSFGQLNSMFECSPYTSVTQPCAYGVQVTQPCAYGVQGTLQPLELPPPPQQSFLDHNYNYLSMNLLGQNVEHSRLATLQLPPCPLEGLQTHTAFHTGSFLSRPTFAWRPEEGRANMVVGSGWQGERVVYPEAEVGMEASSTSSTLRGQYDSSAAYRDIESAPGHRGVPQQPCTQQPFVGGAYTHPSCLLARDRENCSESHANYYTPEHRFEPTLIPASAEATQTNNHHSPYQNIDWSCLNLSAPSESFPQTSRISPPLPPTSFDAVGNSDRRFWTLAAMRSRTHGNGQGHGEHQHQRQAVDQVVQSTDISPCETSRPDAIGATSSSTSTHRKRTVEEVDYEAFHDSTTASTLLEFCPPHGVHHSTGHLCPPEFGSSGASGVGVTVTAMRVEQSLPTGPDTTNTTAAIDDSEGGDDEVTFVSFSRAGSRIDSSIDSEPGEFIITASSQLETPPLQSTERDSAFVTQPSANGSAAYDGGDGGGGDGETHNGSRSGSETSLPSRGGTWESSGGMDGGSCVNDGRTGTSRVGHFIPRLRTAGLQHVQQEQQKEQHQQRQQQPHQQAQNNNRGQNQQQQQHRKQSHGRQQPYSQSQNAFNLSQDIPTHLHHHPLGRDSEMAQGQYGEPYNSRNGNGSGNDTIHENFRVDPGAGRGYGRGRQHSQQPWSGGRGGSSGGGSSRGGGGGERMHKYQNQRQYHQPNQYQRQSSPPHASNNQRINPLQSPAPWKDRGGRGRAILPSHGTNRAAAAGRSTNATGGQNLYGSASASASASAVSSLHNVRAPPAVPTAAPAAAAAAPAAAAAAAAAPPVDSSTLIARLQAKQRVEEQARKMVSAESHPTVLLSASSSSSSRSANIAAAASARTTTETAGAAGAAGPCTYTGLVMEYCFGDGTNSESKNPATLTD